MRTALALLSLVLAACTLDNPAFFIGQTSDTKTSTGPDQPTTSATSSIATDPTGPDSSTGPAATTTADTSSSTQHVDPSTSTSTSGSTGTGDTGGTVGTVGTTLDPSTGDTTDSTTGEPPEEVYYALYPLCPTPQAEWYGGAAADSPVPCAASGQAPEVIPLPMTKGLFDVELSDVLELAPSLEPGGAVVGVFGPFMLTAPQQLDAELFTAVMCATNQQVGSCTARASAWVRTGGQDWMKMSTQVKNGQVVAFVVKLFEIPLVNMGDGFEIYLQADVDGDPHVEDRVYFVNPRIRQKG